MSSESRENVVLEAVSLSEIEKPKLRAVSSPPKIRAVSPDVGESQAVLHQSLHTSCFSAPEVGVL